MAILIACKSKTKKEEIILPATDSISKETNYIATTTQVLPWKTEWDSGYFKGPATEKISDFESKDTTELFKFLTSLINKKQIIWLDSQTLSHSVFINQKTKIRYDTLRNKIAEIISVYKFDSLPAQRITINRIVVKDYKLYDKDDSWDDIYDIEHESFRHFKFKNREYYYFTAFLMDMGGTSAGNAYQRFIYDVKNKKLSNFESCRFSMMLFGDVNGDENLDCLDFDNSDFCTTVPWSDNVVIKLYSCNNRGNFGIQKDKAGKEYFIDGTTGEDFRQDSFNVNKHYWPVKLK